MRIEEYLNDIGKKFPHIILKRNDADVEDEKFKIIEIHSSSIEMDDKLPLLQDEILDLAYSQGHFDYLANMYFYKDSEEYIIESIVNDCMSEIPTDFEIKVNISSGDEFVTANKSCFEKTLFDNKLEIAA